MAKSHDTVDVAYRHASSRTHACPCDSGHATHHSVASVCDVHILRRIYSNSTWTTQSRATRRSPISAVIHIAIARYRGHQESRHVDFSYAIVGLVGNIVVVR